MSREAERVVRKDSLPKGEGADVRPSYAGLFRCIGPECEDTCCAGWDIPVDKVTYQKYRAFPKEKLGLLVEHFVLERTDDPPEKLHALIQRLPDEFCPFFGADKLCAIQKEYGAELLSSTCSLYPRSLAVVGGVLEGSLSLSCPEAARMVLLRDESTEGTANLFSGEFRTDNVFEVREQAGMESFILPVRSVVVDLIRDRTRPVWQRLLVVASLCSRLDEIAEGDFVGVSDVLGRYRAAVGQGRSSELDGLEAMVPVRLEMAIELSNRRCRERDCGQRFQSVFWDFIEGVGSAGSEGREDDVQRFQEANTRFLEPFLARSPFIVENYLLNHVYQHLFPFGRAGSKRFVARSMFEEAVVLVIQVSWMETLLIGVAGHYGSEFGEAQLITTVQSFTRAVEHVPQVLEDALDFVRGRGLDTIEGLAKLLRTRGTE